MSEKVIIVTGSRDWTDALLLGRVLNIHEPTLVVQGGARGADLIAAQWAHVAEVPCVTVPADWDRSGKSAGAKRNIEMLERYPDALVLAFPLPSSRGTWHCVFEARKRGHKVMVVKSSEDWSVITNKGQG